MLHLISIVKIDGGVLEQTGVFLFIFVCNIKINDQIKERKKTYTDTHNKINK